MTPFEISICIFVACSLIMIVICAFAKPEKTTNDEIHEEHIHGNYDNDEMLFMQ